MKVSIYTLLFCFLASSVAIAQDYEKRIKELGIELLEPTAPVANYLKAVTTGNLVYMAGHGPSLPGGGYITGKVGRDLTEKEGYEAARQAGIAILSSLKNEIGDLNRVNRIVKVLGMVNAVPEFGNQPEVINGFSDLMVEIFGENGKHARSAVGMGSLPRGISVEIEVIFELKE